jgi:hypothetical protein
LSAAARTRRGIDEGGPTLSAPPPTPSIPPGPAVVDPGFVDSRIIDPPVDDDDIVDLN